MSQEQDRNLTHIVEPYSDFVIEVIKHRNYHGQQNLRSVAQELDVLALFDQAINPLLGNWSIFSTNEKKSNLKLENEKAGEENSHQ